MIKQIFKDKLFLVALLVIVVVLFFESSLLFKKSSPPAINFDQSVGFWNLQSIDTTKYSRDLAREKLYDPSFGEMIDHQVAEIAKTGATHLAVGTPYDQEFMPFLKKWVNAARKNGLNIWFRGNFSGWEGWFGYGKIGREEHLEKTKKFILDNGDLFKDGDIFSACPECENGGPGDPRHNGDVNGHRKFLIEEYQVTREAFRLIGKNVSSNYHSMNGDVARLVMDKETTRLLGGIVVIDHYVADPNELSKDIIEIGQMTGGKVILGEFGVPIPDIHGKLDANAQAEWIGAALERLASISDFSGLNYWVSFGGTTEIWDASGKPKKAVEVIGKYFQPKYLTGRVVNEAGKGVGNAEVKIGSRSVLSDKNGYFAAPYIDNIYGGITVNGYNNQEFSLPVENIESSRVYEFFLTKLEPDLIYKIQKFVYNLSKSVSL